jgi:hypothetical protein
MPMIAQKAPYTLIIEDDQDPLNPREEYSNFGKMMCWHSRYNLGDKHDFKEPEHFLQDILFKHFSGAPDYGKSVYDFIKQGNAEHIKLEYNRSAKEWELLERSYWSEKSSWYTRQSYPANLKGKDVPDWFLEECLSGLTMSELMKLAQQAENFIILPLYLYDHSGITMNTTGFTCPWDSGQVGFIYASYDDVKKVYSEITPETLKKAENLLRCEVKTYDYYITGQCYGFKLFEGFNEIESCRGFLGELSDVQESIKEYLPEDCEVLADSLVYQMSVDEEELLEQLYKIDFEQMEIGV